MKYKQLLCATGTTLAVLLAVLAIGTPLAAQEHKPKHSPYILKDLGTLGGSYSQVNSLSVVINEEGTVVGGSTTADIDVFHAYKWQKGILTDLGTLPGGDAFSFAIEINSAGLIAGISDNGLIDPISGTPAFVATAWSNGNVTDLGTFGGSFSLPDGINSRGQLVGGAQNTIPDPFNSGDLFILPSGTQWRATMWQDGKMRDLGTLGDGQDAFAFSVNESGQVAGLSFTNSTPNPTTGYPTLAPFLWENGRMRDLGSLGGTSALVAKINNRGQVAGNSNLAGDLSQHAFLWGHGRMKDLGTLGGTFSGAAWLNDSGDVVGDSTTTADSVPFHGFLWRHGAMTDLGGAPGDTCSHGNSINSKGQVVGQSFVCTGSTPNAFLWENGGPAVDLNTLVPHGSGLQLIEAQFINDHGEIAGVAQLPNGDFHAFLLVPREERNDNATLNETGRLQDTTAAVAQESTNATPGQLTPEGLAALRARFTHRSRGFGLKPAK
jgi:probable HAF family extracellular repeat protein